MRKEIQLLMLGIGAAICLTSWQVIRPKEPLYRGKRISDWVVIYCGDQNDAYLHFRAVCNLIDLGTNAAPTILELAGTRDSAVKKLLLKVPIPDKLLEIVKLKVAYKRWAGAAFERPRMATSAFLLMGRENQSAVPGLIKLLSSDNPPSRSAAAEMLAAVGARAQELCLLWPAFICVILTLLSGPLRLKH